MFLRYSIILAIAVILLSQGTKSQKLIWGDSLIAFSSEYISNNKSAYKAAQILGRPSSLPGNYHESECAWAPFKANAGYEFIHVGFNQMIKPRQIIINQNMNMGAVVSVVLYDSKGDTIFYQEDVHGFKTPEDNMSLNFIFEKSKIYASSLKIELNTSLSQGYNMIDAVGLTDDSDSINIFINLVPGSMEPIEKELLPETVNSKAKELLPLITPDGKTLYFTRWNHPKNNGYVGGISSQDIWFSKMDENGYFLEAVHLDAPLNNEFDNSICSITPDGQKALLLNVYEGNSMEKGVSMTHKRSESWLMPAQINIEKFYNNHKHGEYCLAASGRVIIMAIERDDSYGSKDCYYSVLQDNGIWSEPANLGPVINTASSEVSPFLAADDRTLYYSTSGLPGYGRQDIFVTRRIGNSWTNWSEPQNLGPSINSASFDAYYSIPASGEFAYFSSVNGTNLEDIYRVTLPKNARPQAVVLVKGFVYNAKTKEPVAATIIYESLTTGKEIGEAHSSAVDGSYSIALPRGELYGFRARAKGYASISENIDLTNLEYYKEYYRDLYLVPLEIGSTIRLNNVFFEYDKSDITPETTHELDRLVELMNEYPEMKIEIAGHSDSIGTDNYNLRLSTRRAKAVFDYLLLKSISKERLSYIGYGESKPIALNETEEGRSINRRVEFKIIKM